MAPEVREKAVRVGNDMAGNFEKPHKAGVRVAYGTDSGISPHGTNAEEAVLMVDAGMSEMDVIVTATVNASDLIDMSDSIGTIEVGKFADIIAVDASPLDDISELLDVDFVMKGGKIFKMYKFRTMVLDADQNNTMVLISCPVVRQIKKLT